MALTLSLTHIVIVIMHPHQHSFYNLLHKPLTIIVFYCMLLLSCPGVISMKPNLAEEIQEKKFPRCLLCFRTYNIRYRV